jgi:hypothetical protein
MTLSDFRRITDELLSAYIDDEVTEQERAFVEAAIAQDEEIAWRLNSLRQTVSFLRELPELALPRSFALTLDQVAQANDQSVGVGAMREEAMATPAAPPRLQRQVAPTPQAGFWVQVAEGWRRFWQGGNPMLRNAAAVSFALMLFLAGGGQLLNRALTQPVGVGMMATAPEAPAAAPAASEAMPATQAVAIAPTATAAASESASLQVQEDSSLKTPVEEAPAEESARIMQAPAESASDTSQATTDEATDAASAARASSESVAAESADTAEGTEESTEGDAAVQAGEAAVAEAAAAPASDAPVPTATVEEPAVAAAMAAPEQPQGDEMPPLVANPQPGGRPQSGGGGGGMGGGPEGPVGGGGETGDLVPEEAHAFDVNPVGAPTPLPAEEGVTASAAAAPAEASAASAANVAVTPAVDEVVPEGEEEIAAASVASETMASEVPISATPAPTEQVAVTAYAEPTVEPTDEPTPEAVALVAPGAITSSEIVANVESEGATPAVGPAGTVPVVWVAQGSAFLLTIVLASLWWRSRTPRRPRGS